MAKQVKGARANKPNDSFGVVNNPNLYRNKYREEVYKDEEEVENEEQQEESSDPTKQVATQKETEQSESFVSPEKKESVDFKKRYDDLKKHYDAKLNEWRLEKQHLSDQIESFQPNAKEQNDPSLDDFKTQYPDVYNAIDRISTSNSDNRVKKLEEQLSVLKEKEAKLEKDKSYQELLRLQPDFDSLKSEDKFLNWLDSQPKSISDGIYNNNTDAQWASRVVDLYKADVGSPKKSKTVNKSKDAAMSVSKTIATDIATSDHTNKKLWKGSDIAKMKPWEFEKFEKDIDQARSEGRIDLNS